MPKKSFGAGGPFHCGHQGDKHRLGHDRDGNAMNSGHLSTRALWYDDGDRDGPFLFEGKYPNPGPLPLMSRVHLAWDGRLQHPWIDGPRTGMWRWWAEVPYVTPPGGRIPTVVQPPPTGGPPGPGGPTTPGGPGSPAPPGGPTTGGPGGPRSPAPPGPGAPGGGGPITPNPLGPLGPRFPGYPTTGPTTGGNPPPPQPGDPLRGGRYGAGRRHWHETVPPPWPRVPNPTTPNPGGRRFPGLPATDPVGAVNGQEGQETGFQPVLPAGALEELPYETGEPDPPGIIPTVGAVTPQDRTLYAIHHPMMESWASMSFRPQLWINGYPSFEHNPKANPHVTRLDESVRPQVLAMRAWGAQAGGDWAYTDQPADSRARGGTANGGVLFSPPEFEMEDYLGIGSTADVASPGTTSYVTAAPGVGFALGTPRTDGGLAAASIVISQGSTANRVLRIQQLNSSRVATDLLTGQLDQASGEVVLVAGGSQAFQVPRGTTAQRPSGTLQCNLLQFNQ